MKRLSKHDRVILLARWLKDHYPVAYPIQVRFIRNLREGKEKLDGHSYRRGRKLYIDLEDRQVFGHMIDTLIHEWSHLVHLPFDRLEYRKIRLRPHEPATGWCVTYGSIYSDIHDDPVRYKV